MANKRVRDNAAILASGVASGDAFFIDDLDANADKKIVASELRAYILDGKTVGGTSAGDIVNNNSAQTLTNKRMTLPCINSAIQVTADSAEINKLDGLTATTANLQLTATYAAKIPYLANVTSDLQAQINAINSLSFERVWGFGETFTADGTSQTYAAETIMLDIGIDTSAYAMDPTSLVITTAFFSGGKYIINDDNAATTPNIVTDYTITTSGGNTYVNNIKIDGLTNAEQYNFAMTFKLITL